MSGLVALERHDAVSTITLDRADRHNALVPELLAGLRDAVAAADADEPRAVVLRADGPSFSTGGDLAGFRAHADDLPAYADRLVGLLNECVCGLWGLRAPLVVAAQGAVTGGALGLLLAGDVVLAADDAWIAPYYAEVGFSPDGGWTALLPPLVGRLRAVEAQVRNRRVLAAEAREWGLVSEVVERARLDARAAEVAAGIARLRPGSLRRARELSRPSRDEVAAALERERRAFVEHIATEEARRGIERFSPRAPAREEP